MIKPPAYKNLGFWDAGHHRGEPTGGMVSMRGYEKAMRRRFAGSAEIRRQPVGRTSQLRLSTLLLSRMSASPFPRVEVENENAGPWPSARLVVTRQHEIPAKRASLAAKRAIFSLHPPVVPHWPENLPSALAQDSTTGFLLSVVSALQPKSRKLRGRGLAMAAFRVDARPIFIGLAGTDRANGGAKSLSRRPLRHREMESHRIKFALAVWE